MSDVSVDPPTPTPGTPLSPQIVLSQQQVMDEMIVEVIDVCNVQLQAMATRGDSALSILLWRGVTESVADEVADRFSAQGWDVIVNSNTDPAPTLYFGVPGIKKPKKSENEQI